MDLIIKKTKDVNTKTMRFFDGDAKGQIFIDVECVTDKELDHVLMCIDKNDAEKIVEFLQEQIKFM